MDWIQAFRTLPEWDGISHQKLEYLLQRSQLVQLPKESPVIIQFCTARYLYLLVSGSIVYYMTADKTSEPLYLGGTRQPWAAIGWSGFRHPHRYLLSAKCTKTSTLVRWSHEDLDNILSRHPALRPRFLRLLGRGCVEQLIKSRRLMMQPPPHINQYPETKSVTFSRHLNQFNDHRWLTCSPLFQNISHHTLSMLARFGWIVLYRKNTCVFTANEPPVDGLLILVSGKVNFYFHKGVDADRILLRTLTSAGDVVSWSCLVKHAENEISAGCALDSAVYFIPNDKLNKLILSDTAFARQLQKNLFEIIAEDLRCTRAYVIKKTYKNELLAVQALTRQLGPQLPVDSAIHKIPYLLQNPLTQNEAICNLQKLTRSHKNIEKNSAQLFLDILRETNREARYYQGLQQVYAEVVEARTDLSPKTLRNRCAATFADTLKHTHYTIAGTENLPIQTGHIFIVNHLISYPSYKLANGFELALDTHFVSAAILLPEYGDAGVRVVRKARGEEYAHQHYYDRLGHIDVLTDESENAGLYYDRSQHRQQFYREASEHLRDGHNVVICPEGTSYPAAASPGPFKTGVFRLALQLNPEPYIVPIVLANFDKSVQSSAYAALIKQPFKLSSKINRQDNNALTDFLVKLRLQYKEDFAQVQLMATQLSTKHKKDIQPILENPKLSLHDHRSRTGPAEFLRPFIG